MPNYRFLLLTLYLNVVYLLLLSQSFSLMPYAKLCSCPMPILLCLCRLKKNDICCYLDVPRLVNNPLIVLAIKIACYCSSFWMAVWLCWLLVMFFYCPRVVEFFACPFLALGYSYGCMKLFTVS